MCYASRFYKPILGRLVDSFLLMVLAQSSPTTSGYEVQHVTDLLTSGYYLTSQPHIKAKNHLPHVYSTKMFCKMTRKIDWGREILSVQYNCYHIKINKKWNMVCHRQL